MRASSGLNLANTSKESEDQFVHACVFQNTSINTFQVEEEMNATTTDSQSAKLVLWKLAWLIFQSCAVKKISSIGG